VFLFLLFVCSCALNFYLITTLSVAKSQLSVPYGANFVMLDLVSLVVLNQKIGWEERLRYDLPSYFVSTGT